MKKRIFNTVVAVAAAMSLSVCAFAEAADPGVSGPGASDPGTSGTTEFSIPGWSGFGVPGASDSVVGVTIGTGLAEFGSDQGVKITGPGSAFGKPGDVVYLAASLLKPVPADVAADVAKDVEYELASYRPKLVTEKLDVNMALRLDFYKKTGDTFEQIHPTGEITVNVAKVDTNVVAHKTKDAKGNDTFEWIEPATIGQIVTFTATSFSDYYLLDIDQLVADTLTGNEDRNDYPGVDPVNPIPGGDPVTTTQAPEATTTPTPEATTTPAADVNTTSPEATTTTTKDSDTTTTTTKAPGGNTGNTPDDNGNNNVGNDGNGNGPDKNQATGVVLAVIPAAIAACAVVISKKRK